MPCVVFSHELEASSSLLLSPLPYGRHDEEVAVKEDAGHHHHKPGHLKMISSYRWRMYFIFLPGDRTAPRLELSSVALSGGTAWSRPR